MQDQAVPSHGRMTCRLWSHSRPDCKEGKAALRAPALPPSAHTRQGVGSRKTLEMRLRDPQPEAGTLIFLEGDWGRLRTNCSFQGASVTLQQKGSHSLRKRRHKTPNVSSQGGEQMSPEQLCQGGDTLTDAATCPKGAFSWRHSKNKMCEVLIKD